LSNFYLGNLDWHATEQDITDLFAPYGNISSVKIIRDLETKKSKGFGFIEIDGSEEELMELNGKDFRGRSLKISPAIRKR
jgi:RNA recognition motif-containing protein